MKLRLSLATLAGLVVLGLVAWAALAGDGPNRGEAESTATRSAFRVTGMTCSGCEVGVRRAVKKLDGIEEVEASHEDGTATVTYQADAVTPEEIIEAIEGLGYTAELADEDEAEEA